MQFDCLCCFLLRVYLPIIYRHQFENLFTLHIQPKKMLPLENINPNMLDNHQQRQQRSNQIIILFFVSYFKSLYLYTFLLYFSRSSAGRWWTAASSPSFRGPTTAHCRGGKDRRRKTWPRDGQGRAGYGQARACFSQARFDRVQSWRGERTNGERHCHRWS